MLAVSCSSYMGYPMRQATEERPVGRRRTTEATDSLPVGHVAAIGVAYRAGIQDLSHVDRPSTSSWQGEKVLVMMGIKDRFSDMAAPSSMTASPARQLYGRLKMHRPIHAADVAAIRRPDPTVRQGGPP